MAYQHIENLYKNQDILLFKECYAMEKIHGTSANISYKEDQLHLFPGGAKSEDFAKIFNTELLLELFRKHYSPTDSVTIFGEAYGGKMQGMSRTYGQKLCFIVFEVKVNLNWLSVPIAQEVASNFGLEFVPYTQIPTTMEAIDAERDRPSIVAEWRGCGTDKMREGIVLRPLREFKRQNGERIVAKHKRAEFCETRTPRAVTDKLKVETDYQKIVDEWVTRNRLSNIIGRGEVELCTENIGKIIPLMIEDIYREAQGEIEVPDSKELRRRIGHATALLIKKECCVTL